MEQRTRTFFVDSVTYERTRILCIERYASLFIEILTLFRDQGKYSLHEFVLMPDHFHLLITPNQTCSLERAVQFIKGGYSYQVRKRLRMAHDVWQRSFMVRRVMDVRDYQQHRTYIHQNPVKARLVARAEDWEYGSARGTIRLDPPPPHLRG